MELVYFQQSEGLGKPLEGVPDLPQLAIRPVLGAAKLRSLRFEATGSRGVLKQGGNQGEQRTPK